MSTCALGSSTQVDPLRVLWCGRIHGVEAKLAHVAEMGSVTMGVVDTSCDTYSVKVSMVG